MKDICNRFNYLWEISSYVSNPPISAISVAEARIRLEKIKPLLLQLKQLYNELVSLEKHLASIDSDQDISILLTARNELTIKEDEMIDLQQIFHDNDCVIKNIPTGLIDFVAVRNGKLVWLCFRDGETDLQYYHEWDTGFVARKPIDFQ